MKCINKEWVNTHIEEIKTLKKGDKILVYNCDWRTDMSATVKSIEITKDGTEEDVQIYFIDEGTYEDEHGHVYDEETKERTDDYMGWCTACDYVGRLQ